MDPLAWSTATNLALTGAVLPLATASWFAYFIRKGGALGSKWTGLLALFLGLLAVPQALVAYDFLDGLGLEVTWESLADGPVRTAVSHAFLIGLVEEGAKLLPITLIVLLKSGPIRPVHVLLWAALSGVGFAAAENGLMLVQGGMDWREGLARAAAAPVTHALFAAPWGLGLGAFIVRRTYGPVVWGGAVSVLAHALYDLVLARREIPNLLAISIVLALWVWLIVRTAQKSRLILFRSLEPLPTPSLRPGVLLRNHHVQPLRARSIQLEA